MRTKSKSVCFSAPSVLLPVEVKFKHEPISLPQNMLLLILWLLSVVAVSIRCDCRFIACGPSRFTSLQPCGLPYIAPKCGASEMRHHAKADEYNSAKKKDYLFIPLVFAGGTADVHRHGLSWPLPHRLHRPLPLAGLRQEELPQPPLPQLAARVQCHPDDVRGTHADAVVEEVGRSKKVTFGATDVKMST